MLDEDNYRYIRNNEIINLTVHENIILALLIKNKGSVTTFNDIAQALYGSNSDTALNLNINLKIYRLRKKLKNEFKIYNRPGIGYFV